MYSARRSSGIKHGWKSGPKHEEIGDESGHAAVAVGEGVDAHEARMKPGKEFQGDLSLC